MVGLPEAVTRTTPCVTRTTTVPVRSTENAVPTTWTATFPACTVKGARRGATSQSTRPRARSTITAPSGRLRSDTRDDSPTETAAPSMSTRARSPAAVTIDGTGATPAGEAARQPM